jgi:flagellar protein FliO/FliZ
MSTSALMPLLAFVAVVAMIPLALWLMRRAGVGGAAQGNLMRVVSSLSLSPSQKIVIVELMPGAGGQWMVLGVTGENINILTTLAAPAGVPLAISEPHAPSVAQLIERFRQGGKVGDGNHG